jgi:type IV secretory pathway TraG/TraD family ATPase VirD4
LRFLQIARAYALAERTREEWMESTLNKVNAFLSDDRIREIFPYQKSSFNLREIIDNKKILLIKLDRGRLKENGDLLGSLLMTKIRMAAFSRSDVPKEQRVPFYLYIDEFQNFATQTFIDTLSEARKYGLVLIMLIRIFLNCQSNYRIPSLQTAESNATSGSVGGMLRF